MPDASESPSRISLEEVLARSRALNRDALASAGVREHDLAEPNDDPSPAIALTDRLRAIRASLELLSPGASDMPDPAREARTRLNVALSAMPSGERRRSARWPLFSPVLLALDGASLPARTLDVGAGGAMLAPLSELRPGDLASVALALSTNEWHAGTVKVDRDGVGHLAFDLALPKDAELQRRLSAIATTREVALWQVAALANEVELVLETWLRDQFLSPRELFGGAGYPPAASKLFDTALAALLATAMPADASSAYVAAVDSDGYVAAETIGPEEPLARNGRHIRDAVTLRAARFAAGPIVQTYRRLPGREPEGVVSDASAPVFVRGRRWGCVQIGRNLVSCDAASAAPMS